MNRCECPKRVKASAQLAQLDTFVVTIPSHMQVPVLEGEELETMRMACKLGREVRNAGGSCVEQYKNTLNAEYIWRRLTQYRLITGSASVVPADSDSVVPADSVSVVPAAV